MQEQPLSPTSETTIPQSCQACAEDIAIELPPLQGSGDQNTLDWSDTPRTPSRWAKLLGSAVLAAGLLVGGFALLPNSGDESQHPNWPHVATATQASAKGSSQFVSISSAGTPVVLPALEVTAADADRLTTQRLRGALIRNDLATATSILQNAQRIPAAPDNDVQLPDLSADGELVSALKEGRKELFQIDLFDCCQEDGDVVEVLVNGSHFSTVPITNAGTLLSIPLSSGSNTITILGTRDGRGGVTLSLRTSRGDFFARRMHVGEAYKLGVVVQ